MNGESGPARNASRSEAGRRGLVADGLPKAGEPLFDAENILLQRRMRFNPLRTLDPENLSISLDQWDIGILRQAALLWDAMTRRDDTLITVKRGLENAVKCQDWQVLKRPGAPEPEASRHAAALQYFYDNLRSTDAFDRNIRGGLDTLIEQMTSAVSYRYSVHHFVWKPRPGRMVDVEGAAPVPALTAEMEHVPIWYFENTTGTLRFLPFGGFGIVGEACDWESDWMCAVSTGLMFAASICYVFKRLTFQDWTIFNERYAQAKPVGQTNATRESSQGQAMAGVIENFNSDMGIVLYEQQVTDKLPISLLGPSGTASVDLFERFLDRQDRKLTVMYRGSDLRSMSRGADAVGASVQQDETVQLERGYIRAMAQALHEGIDRKVIRFCFGEDVEPLARMTTPDLDKEDTADIRESAGFLADRGGRVRLGRLADRLGIELVSEEETEGDGAEDDILQALGAQGVTEDAPDEGGEDPDTTANSGGQEGSGQWLVDGLKKLLAAPDEKFRAGVEMIAGGMPEFAQRLMQDHHFVEEIYGLLAAAVNGRTANAGFNRLQPRNKGKFAGYPEGPDKVTLEEAEKLLTEGVTETNPAGGKVHFGALAKAYLDKKSDGADRKRFLPWARETVKTTVPESEGNTDIYSKIFHRKGSKKGFVVLVSVRQGEVFNFYPKPAHKL